MVHEVNLKDLQANPYAILGMMSVKEIAALVKKANAAYHKQGQPLLSDDLYDLVINYLAKLSPDHPLVQSEVGAAVSKKEKVALPVYMASLNKIKDDPAAIDRWVAKWPGEYVISDKLDGISALVQVVGGNVSMYTRGDGTHGQNIKHLLPHIHGIPKFTASTNDLLVRGELILPRVAWDTIFDRANPRNTVAGLANSRRLDESALTIASLVHFVAYESIEPRLKPSDAMAFLKRTGFEVVHHVTTKPSSVTVDALSEILMTRRKESIYDVDGIVVVHNDVHENESSINPPYAFAFKSILTHDKAEVIVKEVQWNVSKHGVLKPVVTFDTVYLSNAHISRASGHNAQMIKKNGIGPGARIVIIRSGDVIPYIYSIVNSAETTSLPDPVAYPWKWNDSGVEIVLKHPELAAEYALKQLTNYATVFGIKGIGAKLVKRLYDNGIDTVKKLANITKVDLYKACRSAEITKKIYTQLQEIFSKARCVEFMNASNVFGAGLGQNKLRMIAEAIPSVLNPDAPYPQLADIVVIKGIGERNARQFLDHLTDFHQFMYDAGLPCRSSKIDILDTPEGCMSIVSKNIVFTGFRSKELTEYIEQHGGRVMTGVTTNIHILVARSNDDESTKSEMARELEIPIMAQKDFEEEIGFGLATSQSQGQSQEEEIDDKEFEEFMQNIDKEGLEENPDEDEEEAETGALNKTAECVRHAMNWSQIKRGHIFGKSAYNFEMVKDDLSTASPKLAALIAKIIKLDKNDMEKHGRTFKHMIFTDVVKRAYGAKIVAAALAASGFIHAYDGEFKMFPQKRRVNKNESLANSPDSVNSTASTNSTGGAPPVKNCFAVISGAQIYTKPITVDFKQKLLSVFNKRPDNVYGDLIRIIVLDTGYKEGIDLFDIKYVHLFEPMLTLADEMQAMGRALRLCGQKGLHFDKGWTVHVYKYDHVVLGRAAEFGGEDSLSIIMKQMNKNKQLIDLSRDFERVCQTVAVDRLLNLQVHHQHHDHPASKLQNDVAKTHSDCKWPVMKVENMCVATDSHALIPSFNDSQRFIRNYFQPSSPMKGMLLWHSLGSGKTCTALGTASLAWEANGYTILWVTRSTLRSDVYKNMFDQSCVDRVRDHLQSGKKMPEALAARKRLLSKSWLPPISYKQFNNALLRQNRLFDYLVRRNGYADPFKKTLLIIDEAHLLMSPTMKEKDKPDVNLLKTWLRHSYKVSGTESARLILMSATPVVDNPFDFMRLLNLTGEEDLPQTAEDVTRAYLNKSTMTFTKNGVTAFGDAVETRISYLNRMKDIRQFAQPVIHTVRVPISKPEDLSEHMTKLDELDNVIATKREVKTAVLKKEMHDKIDAAVESDNAECNGMKKPADKRTCLAAVKAKTKALKANANETVRNIMANAKTELAKAKIDRKATKQMIRTAKKNDMSVLGVLENKCFPSKKKDEENDS